MLTSAPPRPPARPTRTCTRPQVHMQTDMHTDMPTNMRGTDTKMRRHAHIRPEPRAHKPTDPSKHMPLRVCGHPVVPPCPKHRHTPSSPDRHPHAKYPHAYNSAQQQRQVIDAPAPSSYYYERLSINMYAHIPPLCSRGPDEIAGCGSAGATGIVDVTSGIAHETDTEEAGVGFDRVAPPVVAADIATTSRCSRTMSRTTPIRSSSERSATRCSDE